MRTKTEKGIILYATFAMLAVIGSLFIFAFGETVTAIYVFLWGFLFFHVCSILDN